MEIREEISGKIVILSLLGRLDSTASGEFEKRVTALFDGGNGRIIADMSQLDYISSAGLRAFLVGAKRASKDGGQLSICSMQEQVREVFEIAGFSSLFPTYDSKSKLSRDAGNRPTNGDTGSDTDHLAEWDQITMAPQQRLLRLDRCSYVCELGQHHRSSNDDWHHGYATYKITLDELHFDLPQ